MTIGNSTLGLENVCVVGYEELKKKIEAYRVLGKSIILTSGTFDILHIGHCRYLAAAKNQLPNSVLVVGVDSDEKVRRRKGPHRPVVHQEERLEIVFHTRYADLITLKEADDEKWKLIKTVRPDILISSERTEYSEEELKALEEFCGKVVVLESQATTSTTAKIRLLLIGLGEPVKEKLDHMLGAIASLVADLKVEIDRLSGGN